MIVDSIAVHEIQFAVAAGVDCFTVPHFRMAREIIVVPVEVHNR